MPKNDNERAPSKEEQVREAEQRQRAKTAKENPVIEQESPPEPEADLAAPELDLGLEPARGRAPVIDPDAEKAPVMGKSRRDDIVKNFRAQRKEQEQDVTEDMREFNQEGFPLELTEKVSLRPVQEDEEEIPVEEPEVAEEPEVEEEAPLFRLKVRGKEMHVTEDQLFELAQKAAAGDNYLEEARETVDEAKRLKADILAQRESQPAKHTGAQPNTQTTELTQDGGETIEHHDNPFAKAVEAIQFGNPEEAAKILQEATAKMVASQSRGVSEQTIVDRQMQNEVQRADRIAKDFERDNPELANDPFARAAIIDRCVRLQVEDLQTIFRDLKIDPAKFPKTSGEIAHFHSFYRSQGYALTDPKDMLNKSKDELIAWKGGVKPAAKDPAPSKTSKLTVSMTSDRRVRRAAIPTQPSRTVNPKPLARQQTPVVQDRSAIVQQMKAARQAPRLPPKQLAAQRAT